MKLFALIFTDFSNVMHVCSEIFRSLTVLFYITNNCKITLQTPCTSIPCITAKKEKVSICCDVKCVASAARFMKCAASKNLRTTDQAVLNAF